MRLCTRNTKISAACVCVTSLQTWFTVQLQRLCMCLSFIGMCLFTGYTECISWQTLPMCAFLQVRVIPKQPSIKFYDAPKLPCVLFTLQCQPHCTYTQVHPDPQYTGSYATCWMDVSETSMYVWVGAGGVGWEGAGKEMEGEKSKKNRAWHWCRHYCDSRWIAGRSSNFLFESKAEGRGEKLERTTK